MHIVIGYLTIFYDYNAYKVIKLGHIKFMNFWTLLFLISIREPVKPNLYSVIRISKTNRLFNYNIIISDL